MTTKTDILDYITKRTEYLDRLIYHHQCNIPEPDYQEQQECAEAHGEKRALQKVKGMLETTDEAMRDRSEIEERLHNLVGLLAHNDPADDSIVRVHARVLDLIWVLYPDLTLAEMFQCSNDMIAARRKSE